MSNTVINDSKQQDNSEQELRSLRFKIPSLRRLSFNVQNKQKPPRYRQRSRRLNKKDFNSPNSKANGHNRSGFMKENRNGSSVKANSLLVKRRGPNKSSFNIGRHRRSGSKLKRQIFKGRRHRLSNIGALRVRVVYGRKGPDRQFRRQIRNRPGFNGQNFGRPVYGGIVRHTQSFIGSQDRNVYNFGQHGYSETGYNGQYFGRPLNGQYRNGPSFDEQNVGAQNYRGSGFSKQTFRPQGRYSFGFKYHHLLREGETTSDTTTTTKNLSSWTNYTYDRPSGRFKYVHRTRKI